MPRRHTAVDGSAAPTCSWAFSARTWAPCPAHSRWRVSIRPGWRRGPTGRLPLATEPVRSPRVPSARTYVRYDAWAGAGRDGRRGRTGCSRASCAARHRPRPTASRGCTPSTSSEIARSWPTARRAQTCWPRRPSPSLVASSRATSPFRPLRPGSPAAGDSPAIARLVAYLGRPVTTGVAAVDRAQFERVVPTPGESRPVQRRVATQFANTTAPASPDFSGWNWVAASVPSSTAATNRSPCSAHVTAPGAARAA